MAWREREREREREKRKETTEGGQIGGGGGGNMYVVIYCVSPQVSYNRAGSSAVTSATGLCLALRACS